MVAPLLRYETTLTGRCRARPGLFNRQVLQVEWSRQAFSPWPAPPGHADRAAWRETSKRGDPVRFWRDATWQDVQFLGELTSAFRTAAHSTNPTRAAGVPGAAPLGHEDDILALCERLEERDLRDGDPATAAATIRSLCRQLDDARGAPACGGGLTVCNKPDCGMRIVGVDKP